MTAGPAGQSVVATLGTQATGWELAAFIARDQPCDTGFVRYSRVEREDVVFEPASRDGLGQARQKGALLVDGLSELEPARIAILDQGGRVGVPERPIVFGELPPVIGQDAGDFGALR